MRITVAFLAFFFFVACQSNIGEQQKPKNLLSQKEMQRILYDISVLESAINVRHGQLSKHHPITKASVEQYLYKNNIDTSSFRSSLDYYHGSFSEGIAIYDLVLDSLTVSSGN